MGEIIEFPKKPDPRDISETETGKVMGQIAYYAFSTGIDAAGTHVITNPKITIEIGESNRDVVVIPIDDEST